MEKSDFHRLLERYVKGEVTDQEKAKIDAWLNVLESEKISDANLSKEDEDKLFREITNNLSNVDRIVTFRPASWQRSRRSRWVLGVAASIFLIVTITLTVLRISGRPANTLEVVSSDGIEKVIMNDGSIAWLTENSRLTYYERTDEGIRVGELEGEGLFEIAKDPNRPFVLTCGSGLIKVLGTSFSVRMDGERVELLVLTGKVNFSSTSNGGGVDVASNEKAFLINGEITTDHLTGADISAITKSTDYNMQFKDTSLSTVVERLAAKFNVTIEFQEQSIGRCKITGNFTDQSLDNTLKMISEIIDVTYSIDGNKVLLNGVGCD